MDGGEPSDGEGETITGDDENIGGDGLPTDGGGGNAADGDTMCDDRTIEDVWIPTRDGKELKAFVIRPRGEGCRLPTILIQTPYNIELIREIWRQGYDEGMPLYGSRDYNVVAVDWRGFYGSAGAAVAGPQQPYAEDGHDTVEWIAAQLWSDGKVGTWGVSALGSQQYRTATTRPPHLVCAVPIFAPFNLLYSSVYPGGVLRREWVDYLDSLGFGLTASLEAHPTHDIWWSYVERYLDPADIQVPMLIVGGWWDLDNNRTLDIFADLRSSGGGAAWDQHRLLVGSWIHFAAGGWSSQARPIYEGEESYFDTELRIQRDSLAFFDYHLRGRQNEAASWTPVRYYQAGEEIWRGAEAWPPALPTYRSYYLHVDGALITDTPVDAGSLTLTYDPDAPSPTIGGQTISPEYQHGPADQRPVAEQPEALLFQSEPLGDPLSIQGDIKVTLYVSTDRMDTDFAVRLLDVQPDGTLLLIGEGIRRLKFRNGYSMPELAVPGAVYELEVPIINDLAYTFMPGHRLGLIVTSSNYARFDRNPNNGADFHTDPATSLTATNTVFMDADSPSALILPVE